MGEWRHSFTILSLGMRVSGQLHAPAALPASPPGTHWAPHSIRTLRRGENILPLSGIEPRLDYPARSLVAIPTELSRFLLVMKEYCNGPG
jgi:hypothetical protein